MLSLLKQHKNLSACLRTYGRQANRQAQDFQKCQFIGFLYFGLFIVLVLLRQVQYGFVVK